MFLIIYFVPPLAERKRAPGRVPPAKAIGDPGHTDGNNSNSLGREPQICSRFHALQLIFEFSVFLINAIFFPKLFTSRGGLNFLLTDIDTVSSSFHFSAVATLI